MPKHDLLSRHFQRKISEFCEMRIAPISSMRVLENVRSYLIGLIIYRRRPPILNGRLDWTAIGVACGIEDAMTADLKKQLRPALDAIMRWLKVPPVADDVPSAKVSSRTGRVASVTKPAAVSKTRKRNVPRRTEFLPETQRRPVARHRSRSARFRMRCSKQPTIQRVFRMP